MQVIQESSGRRELDKYAEFITNDFLEDYSRIIESKAFRRLQKKTQVVTNPNNHYIRNRLQHTLEATSIGMTIGSELELNVNLIQAILTGHDIGHVLYGHLGERIISKLSGRDFNHETYGVVIAQHIERGGKGLNLTKETLEGILSHSYGLPKEDFVMGLKNEYAVAMYADKIAYVLSDLNDSLRTNTLKKIPECANYLGETQRQRQYKVIRTLVNESKCKDHVCFTEGLVFENFRELRQYLTNNVYKIMDDREDRKNLEKELGEIYQFFKEDKDFFYGINPVIAMTFLDDSEATFLYKNLDLVRKEPRTIQFFGMFEIIEDLRYKNIDYTNPNLDWIGIKNNSEKNLL